MPKIPTNHPTEIKRSRSEHYERCEHCIWQQQVQGFLLDKRNRLHLTHRGLIQVPSNEHEQCHQDAHPVSTRFHDCRELGHIGTFQFPFQHPGSMEKHHSKQGYRVKTSI